MSIGQSGRIDEKLRCIDLEQSAGPGTWSFEIPLECALIKILIARGRRLRTRTISTISADSKPMYKL